MADPDLSVSRAKSLPGIFQGCFFCNIYDEQGYCTALSCPDFSSLQLAAWPVFPLFYKGSE
jgi:hypothetical protein